jgi:hypothetical protein
MRTLAKAATSLLTAGTAAVILTAGTAHATSPAHSLMGTFHLTRTDATGAATVADLDCFVDQDGRDGTEAPTVLGVGTVTDPDAACQELVAVDGDPSLLVVHPTWMVTALVAPVTASASGSWGATDVSWSHTYVNGSELAKYAGDVFVF